MKTKNRDPERFEKPVGRKQTRTNVVFRYIKILLILLPLFLIGSRHAMAQASNYCNEIQDFDFDDADTSNCLLGSNPSCYDKPFSSSYNKVPYWHQLTGTPQINGGASSSPFCATMYGYLSSTPSGNLPVCESIYQRIPNLKKGHKYVVAIRHKRYSGNGAPGYIEVGFIKYAGVYTLSSYGPYYFDSVTKQAPLTANPGASWATASTCFTADDTFGYIYVRPVGTSLSTFYNPTVLWLHADDVELYELKPNAGRDTSVCDTGISVHLGLNYCAGSPKNITQSFRWYKYPSTSYFSAAPNVTVTPPPGTTLYILKRTLGGCTDYDTVKVCESPAPTVNLGPDTTLCGPACKTYTVTFDSSFKYEWSTGDTTNSITVCKSGVYWVKITNECGCSGTDTVKLTILPEIKISPPDTSVCASALPLTLSVDPGYSSYSWSTGSTTNSTTINSGGTYWVTVTDSNGCSKTDTSHIQVDTSVSFSLGPDITGCQPDTITLCGPAGNLKYSWSTGDTTQCIKVSASGTYSLKVTTPDSCDGTDTVVVTLYPKPTVNATNLGPYCISDAPFTLSNASPSGGTYSGNGVLNGRFSPRAAGPGTHTITYTYTDAHGCSASTTFTVTVKDMPNVEIEPHNSVCVTDASFYLHATPAGGTWSGTAGDSLFNPGSAGVGTHRVTYSYTDTSGCSDADTFYMVVRDTLNAYITVLTPNPCRQMKIKLRAQAHGMSAAALTFHWLDDGTTTQDHWVQGNGTYCCVVGDTSGSCPDTVCIDLNYASCCSKTATYTNYTVTTSETWSDDTVVIEGTLTIAPNGSLTLNNMLLIMKECSKIEIQDGNMPPTGNGGVMTANNSIIGVCDTGWMGIEVWGNIDACSDNPIQGKFVGDHTTIEHADIGVFAGTRSTPPGFSIDRRNWGGGVIQLDYCIFQDNYVDVMFSEYQEAGACGTYCSRQCWLSHGYNNIFKDSKAAEHCDNFASTTCSTYGLSICHIVDFNLKPNVWSSSFCPLYCEPCPPATPPSTWSLDQQTDCTAASPQPSLWDNNTYDNNPYDANCNNATYH